MITGHKPAAPTARTARTAAATALSCASVATETAGSRAKREGKFAESSRKMHWELRELCSIFVVLLQVFVSAHFAVVVVAFVVCCQLHSSCCNAPDNNCTPTRPLPIRQHVDSVCQVPSVLPSAVFLSSTAALTCVRCFASTSTVAAPVGTLLSCHALGSLSRLGDSSPSLHCLDTVDIVSNKLAHLSNMSRCRASRTMRVSCFPLFGAAGGSKASGVLGILTQRKYIQQGAGCNHDSLYDLR